MLTISWHSYALYFSSCAVFPTSSPSLSFPSFVQYVYIHPHAALYSLTLSLYIASFISSLLFHLATLYTSLTTFEFLHLVLPYCEFITQVIQLSFLPSHTVVHTQVHYWPAVPLCISNSNPSHYLFAHFQHAPYSYYTHASISSTTTKAQNYSCKPSTWWKQLHHHKLPTSSNSNQINLSSQCIRRYLIPHNIPPSTVKIHSSAPWQCSECIYGSWTLKPIITKKLQ